MQKGVEIFMAKACQLFSGSSGNSIFISGGNAKFLVDAGVSAKRIGEALSSIGENPQDLTAVFVTHEHIDHIKGIRVFAKKYNIPVFAQADVLDKMRDGGDVNEYISAEAISENMELSGVEILPFKLSHDSVACVGYRFNLPGGRSVSVCTDTGFVTDGAHSTLAGSDLVFLESNHETKMLENGFYPYQLKKRIMSERGHLSNDACAVFAAELAKGGTTRFCLAHLSRENNHPDVARQTTVAALSDAGFAENVDYRLRVSSPVNSERPIVL